MMSKNALGSCYECMNYDFLESARELVAKVLNSSKLWLQIPDCLKNCKNCLRIIQFS